MNNNKPALPSQRTDEYFHAHEEVMFSNGHDKFKQGLVKACDESIVTIYTEYDTEWGGECVFSIDATFIMLVEDYHYIIKSPEFAEEYLELQDSLGVGERELEINRFISLTDNWKGGLYYE